MPTPPLPVPRYINSDIATGDILQVINIGTGSGQISLDTINQQIAASESDVEVDLATWYTIPFQTNTTPPLDWTNLTPTTYGYLYNLFLVRSQYNIYRTYFGITGENKGDDFWVSQLSKYNEILKRFYKLDQTDNYLYQAFTDLLPNPIGMKRILGLSRVGILGSQPTDNAEYALRNTQRPRFNWG